MRFDHTQWLIHFVRDRKPDQDFPDTEEEIIFLSNSELSSDATAFSVLRTIIRLGGLLPGYSFRNGKTTIYGGQPALCATEMPIYSFSKYVRERDRPDAVSAYGIAFLKSEFYTAGGRPAIYGLSTETPQYISNTALKRVFKDTTLPLSEQYRYVAYSLGTDKWIDWSHEREWRWKATDKDKHHVIAMTSYEVYDWLPALRIFSSKKDNGFFSKVGIIVWNAEEARQIQEDLTGYYLAGFNDYDTPFSRTILENSFIIVLEDVIAAVEKDKRLESQTIEGIQAEKLVEPIILCKDTEAYEPIIEQAVAKAKEAGEKVANEYQNKGRVAGGTCGYANIVCYEVTHPAVQQILKMEIGSGPFDGKVVIYIEGNWKPSQSIDYNEAIAQAMCDVFNSIIADIFYCHSRMD